MTKIGKWRGEIDALDRELKRLLLKRFRLSLRVIEAKRKQGLAKKDARREGEILAILTKKMASREAKFIQSVYREIFRKSIQAAAKPSRRRPRA